MAFCYRMDDLEVFRRATVGVDFKNIFHAIAVEFN